VLGAIALFISHVLKREHEFQEKERSTFTQYEDIIKRAHQEAAELLEKTTATSQQLVSQVRTTNDKLTSDFDRVLQQIAEKQIQAMNQQAEGLKKGYQQKVTNMETAIDQNTKSILQNAESDFDKQLDTFAKSLLAHATKSEQAINNKTKELLDHSQAEIDAYKKEQLAKVDKAILELIQKTYQDILGKSIPASVHQEMILEALEKTKKEGVFDL
jgi:vacuolar-type H+-ATPase subunit H